MKIDLNTHFLIVGLGLMGGSYARGLTKKGYHVTAITKEQSSVDFALKEGIIRDGSTQVREDLIQHADIIVFALYPHVFLRWIRENQELLRPGTLLTDVTGVKGGIVDEVQSILRPDVEFIAAHPMAGREVYGVENSDETIFYQANYLVVPTEKNTDEAIEACAAIGHILEFARISEISPEKHDEMVAFLSQLAHCIAICLMTCNKSEHLEDYTGDSFRDLTRIANINESMWSELFLMNKQALLKEMHLFETDFHRLMDKIEKDDLDGIQEMMRQSTAKRKRFDKQKKL